MMSVPRERGLTTSGILPVRGDALRRARVRRRPTLEDLEGRLLLAARPVDVVLAAETAIARLFGQPAHPGGTDRGRAGTDAVPAIRPVRAEARLPGLTASLGAGPDAVGGVTVAGKTYPKARIKLDIGADGSIERVLTADKKGRFRLTFQVPEGSTPVKVIGIRKGRKSASALLTINRPSSNPNPIPNPGPISNPTPVDNSPPTIAILARPPAMTNAAAVVSGRVADDSSGVVSLTAQVDAGPAQAVALDGSGGFVFATALPTSGSADGTHTILLSARDAAGNLSSPAKIGFTLDTRAPVVTLDGPAPGLTSKLNVTVNGRATDLGTGLAALMAMLDAGTPVAVPVDPATGAFTYSTGLPLNGTAEGPHTVTLTAADRVGNASPPVVYAFTLDTLNPAVGATPLDPTVATTVAAASQFLYTGADPVQTGMAPDTIQPQRAAVLRGQVRDRGGEAIPGVTVTILDHPEFGATTTRADGLFDMAVNGGGSLTVNYARAGYLPVQRQESVPWQDFTWLPDVVLIPQDAQVSTIDLSVATTMQVARGSVSTDSDGTRQATLLFPAGTQASMVLPDGSTQPMPTLHVRATEYTVGPTGPAAMPGDLPATSGYTYAVELSVDEAQAAGATGVRFDRPVPFYVEDFLKFQAGVAVPVGYYDRQQGRWVGSDNGRVIKVLSITNGLADLDLDGSGQPAGASALSALGIDDPERARLAALYQPGQGLWRVPLTHFSPWDCNWPYGLPDGAAAPDGSPSSAENGPDDCCAAQGSIIAVQSQAIGESVPLAGTSFALDYHSDREPGRLAARVVNIPLSGAQIPPNLQSIVLEVEVAGRRIQQTFPAAPNQSTTFTWDGLDAYGRTLLGGQPITVRIGYVYRAVYLSPQQIQRGWASVSGVPITGSRARREITLWKVWHGTTGTWDSHAAGLGGWDLDIHNAYDPNTGVLYLGDGTRRSSADPIRKSTITTVAGSFLGAYVDGVPATQTKFSYPTGVGVGPDGSLYISASGNYRIARVGPDGIIHSIVGDGTRGYGGDGGPASQARIGFVWGVALGPDGSLYFADQDNNRVRRVGPDGIITTVAGDGTRGYGGDGGPATQAQINFPYAVAVGPDGSLYIADGEDYRIRRVGPDGTIMTVVGDGTSGSSGAIGDGGPASQAKLTRVSGLALGPDGSLYIAEPDSLRVRRAGPDGIITTVVGSGASGFGGDGGPATQAQLINPWGLTVGPDGSLYIADRGGFPGLVRRVDPEGIISTVAGYHSTPNDAGRFADGVPATQSTLAVPQSVALGPDGSLYIADTNDWVIRRVAPALPGLSVGEIPVASDDGREVYIFGGTGRHLRTLEALTGAVRYLFHYDSSSRLTGVEDGDGNLTTIRRDAAGLPTAIIAPGGQVSTLAVGADGNLALIADPAGGTTALTYAAGGLMATLTDPAGGLHRFTYDGLGRLTRDENPAGGFASLSRTSVSDGFTVTLTTAEGAVSSFQIQYLPDGRERRVNTRPDGLAQVVLIGTDGSRKITDPDGTVTTVTYGADPRFGMQAPVVSATRTTPGGVNSTLTSKRTATLDDPSNPLSLKTLTETVSLNGQVYTTTFDAAARTLTARSPQGRTSTETLDAKGHIVGFSVPGIAPVQYAYDTRGRLSTATWGTRTYTFTYDVQNNLTSLTDPLQQTTALGYDTAGRVTSETLANGSSIGFSYDLAGRLTTLTPPGQTAHAFSYTAVDLLQSYAPPAVGSSASTTTYQYDRDRRLTRVTRPDGSTIDLGYDPHGNLVSIVQPRGTESLSYDPTSGQLTTMMAPDGGTLAFGYDGDLPTDTIWSGPIAGTMHDVYNSDLRLSAERIDGGSPIAFQYDRDGRLTGAGALTLGRDSRNGLLTGTALGGVSDSLSYSNFGELAQYGASFQGAGLYAAQYTRDALGRITRKVETIGGTATTYDYSYDLVGRLTDVTQDGTLTAHYAFDANGNRLTETGPGGTINGTYDAQDRLLQSGATTYTYTADGTLSSRTDTSSNLTTSYTYDALGNLTAVSLQDGRHINYQIDGAGRRIGKSIDGVHDQGLLYRDALRPIAELDGSNAVVSQFVYGSRSNVPDYLIKGGVAYRIITDQVGSVRLVVNTATGQVAQRLDYDAFGRVTRDTNPGFQPFGFAGGLYDRDTGLVRFGARDYDAETGRWTAKDPILFEGDPSNVYRYNGADPINFVDPSGLGGVATNPVLWCVKYPIDRIHQALDAGIKSHHDDDLGNLYKYIHDKSFGNDERPLPKYPPFPWPKFTWPKLPWEGNRSPSPPAPPNPQPSPPSPPSPPSLPSPPPRMPPNSTPTYNPPPGLG